MRCFTALTFLAAAGGFAQAAHAADYAMPYAPPSGPAPIVELGSGWYLRGDIGAGEASQAQLDVGAITKKSSNFGWTGGIGFGYKLSEHFRTDLTLDYFKPQHLDYTDKQVVNCPYTLTSVTDTSTNLPVGFSDSAIVGTCSQKGKSDLAQLNALANVYADLGTYLGVTPYVGAGVGVAQVKYSGYSDYYKTSDGSVYRTDLTPPAGSLFPLTWVGSNPDNTYYYFKQQPKNPRGAPLSFGPQDYSQRFSKTKYTLAFAFMGGFAYAITDQASIDVGYRYVNNGMFVRMPGVTKASMQNALETQQVRVGFRYQID